MSTRRELLKSIPAAGAAGVLHALSRRAAAAQVAMTPEAQQKMSSDEALAALKAGNERFVTGNMRKRDLMGQVRETASGQFPFAAVLGCVDSRVTPELVFDQGVGDIFTARVAGNFANTDIIGSMEFATRVAGARLIVVLGHSECGAVKAACDFAQLANLTSTLSNISPAVYAVRGFEGSRTSKNKEFVQRVAEENVRIAVSSIVDRSPVMRGLMAEDALGVVGAMYDVATGRVSFFS